MSYRKKHIKTKIYKLKKPKKSIFKRPVFWIIFLLAVIIFFTLYVFVFSSNFQIKDIMVSGNEKILVEDIQDLVFAKLGIKFISMEKWSLESKSIFFIDQKKIKKEILNNFPVIESIEINKKIPHSLNIK